MKKEVVFNVCKKYSFLYISLVMFCMVSLYLVNLLPNERINQHIIESRDLLEQEGVFPIYNNTGTEYLGQDNFTDSIMLNTVYHLKDESNLKAIMRMKFTTPVSGEFNGISGLSTIDTSEAQSEISYARYWHGYVTYLKPLLVFFNYPQIRDIQMVLIITLVIISSVMIYKKIDWKANIVFILGLLSINVFRIPLSIQYSGIFMLSIIGLIILLSISEKRILKYSSGIFFVIGGLTSFIDLLTTPIITFGIPITFLMIYLLYKKDYSIKDTFLFIFKCGISWIIGFILIWTSKWIIGSIILDVNIIQDAISQSGVRLNSLPDGFTKASLFKYCFSQNFHYLIEGSHKLTTLTTIMCISIVGLVKGCIKDVEHIKKMSLFLLLGLLPYAWYIVLMNHSAIHAFFTYRNQVITVFVLCILIVYNINFNKLFEKSE